MTVSTDSPLTTADTLPPDLVDSYRRDGFVRVPGVLSRDEAARFRDASLAFTQNAKALGGHRSGRNIFDQFVNVWVDDPTMRELTLNPGIAAIAQKLAGAPLRLWHDHALIKPPHNGSATEFHQDQPYWPHAGGTHPISAWIALVDVPAQRGCMSFIPGVQDRTDLVAQDLGEASSLFEMAPELEWAPKVTLPLKAGDCTFHHGRTPHEANPNDTDQARVAHVVIYIDQTTTYTGASHVVTDPLNLTVGQTIEGELFPEVDA